jgi:hypothetical protein
MIARGGAIAKVLPSPRPSEIVVFGAVHQRHPGGVRQVRV